jgi:mono/diheme cytochrome c family protein
VYATGHEPDNCNGATGATIVITDANGTSLSTQTNSAGNFYFDATTIAFPIHAQVTVDGATRAMTGAVTTGDCNSCHTQAGAQLAPGRVVLP